MFQIDQLGRYHHHIEHGSMDGLEEASRETIARSLKDSSVKERIGGDETDAIVLAVFDFSRIQFALKYNFRPKAPTNAQVRDHVHLRRRDACCGTDFKL
jgi:hypothetical protein